MDKSWMNMSRNSDEYREGVENFLKFAFQHASHDGKILCPCVKCVNRYSQTYEEARVHLRCDGFLSGYTRWICHGEKSSAASSSFVQSIHSDGVESVQNRINLQTNPHRLHDLTGLLNDILGLDGKVNNEPELDVNEEENALYEGIDIEQPREASTGESNEFIKLLEDVNKALYPGCETFSKLSFILQLYHVKCLNGWTGKSFTMLLELLIVAFLNALLPKNFYEAKKIILALGLNYEKIHACRNDCMLFWGENSNEENCKICGSSRWATNKEGEQNNIDNPLVNSTVGNKKPVKILQYFPLIPRLQRLFISTKTSDDMRWHDEKRKKDGMLRHPADGEAWKAFDAKFLDFASDPRNCEP